MKANSLAILSDLAKEARDKAAQLLAGERQTQAQLQMQCETLSQYRAEYASRLNDCMDEGIDAVTLQDYGRFLTSLDKAIESAWQNVHAQAKRVSSRQQDWQAEQRRLSSFTTLSERREAEHRRIEDRKEMRQQDEIANNLFLRARQQLSFNK